MTPTFSVILSTWNRGPHIVPTIRSVLGQRCRDFELLIVGDHCTDDTAEQVRPFLSPTVKWHNLSVRGGSQAFPNNYGLAHGRGRFAAYIGHDDIWANDHLERLSAVIDQGVDFAISGCVFHTPPGVERYFITGLLDAAQNITDFSPPSSFAHNRELVLRTGGWRSPFEMAAPVDHDITLRCVAAGMRFGATSSITVHKFAAGHRYLSYLNHESSEQEQMLALMERPDYATRLASWVQVAKADSDFMSMKLSAFPDLAPGQIATDVMIAKASRRPMVKELGDGEVTIVQPSGSMGMDWHPREGRWRRAGPNPIPKVLIPWSGRAAELTIEARHSDPSVFAQTLLRRGEDVIGPDVALLPEYAEGGEVVADLKYSLQLGADFTVLEVLQPPTAFAGERGKRAGVAFGRMRLRPTRESTY